MAESAHIPVMAAEVLEYLAPRPGGVYVDCTVGGGGHAAQIARRLGPQGRLIGLDRDPAALQLAGERLRGAASRVDLARANFSRLGVVLMQLGAGPVDGLLADFGASSMQMDQAERGFGFAAGGPLDMRMDPSQELTAAQVVNQFGERELADLIFQYGEERRSRRIARAIVRSRPFTTTTQLAGVIAAVTRPMSRAAHARRSRGPHPATRAFQALRIFVNQELEAITAWLAQAPAWLAAGGRVVTIAFHSLEDRPVKQNFQALAREGVYELLTPRVVRPAEAEVAANPRARSARLRACRRTGAALPRQQEAA
ncbi:MAG: 16S rRNA (cytosine(1402)-N(4))-methyltransferase RsmH [Terriglobales bacterium]